MSLTADRDVVGCEFVLEDLIAGRHASGYGQLDGGRTFSFHVEQDTLVAEIYRPRLAGPVPQAEDVVAVARRGVRHIDLSDERSLAAAVRDAVSAAVPVPR